ncbi:MAG: hypothetical protein J6Y95_07930, partial [Lachnospiraceae bacterium]|nr:hypothetical protein [Lachnospiraceae bacterium]
MTFAWGASAEGAEEKTAVQPAQTAASDVQNYEAEFSAEEKAILGLLSESGTLTENKDYEAALKKLAEAKTRIEKFEKEKPGKTAEVLKEKHDIFA